MNIDTAVRLQKTIEALVSHYIANGRSPYNIIEVAATPANIKNLAYYQYTKTMVRGFSSFNKYYLYFKNLNFYHVTLAPGMGRVKVRLIPFDPD
jgi:hypothetical protein